ncbi:MAG: transcription initiation factor TFIIIB [Clostridiales bacterium]|nr:transcription initiation factor TFIIIB [Clostridiales bacterium]
MESKEKCPECGCKEIGRGKMSGYACMVPEGRVFVSSALIAEVCTDCGLILRLKVEKPHKFKRK